MNPLLGQSLHNNPETSLQKPWRRRKCSSMFALRQLRAWHPLMIYTVREIAASQEDLKGTFLCSESSIYTFHSLIVPKLSIVEYNLYRRRLISFILETRRCKCTSIIWRSRWPRGDEWATVCLDTPFWDSDATTSYLVPSNTNYQLINPQSTSGYEHRSFY